MSLSVPDHDKIKNAREELESKLEKHSRIIVDIKICLNALLPVARLPNEILLEIFQHCRCFYDPYASRSDGLDSWWLSITRVCHHWREVAMESPNLWTDINFTLNPRRITELLVRSKEAMLNVRAGYRLYIMSHHTDTNLAASIDALAMALHRAQAINLTLPPNVYTVLADRPRITPHLKAVTLQCPNGSYAASLPTILDDCDLPSLKDVRIRDYRVAWSSSIFAPTLTYLEVYGSRDSGIACRYTEILNGLANLLVLETLILVDCMEQASSNEVAPSTSVTFTRLKCLLLTGDPLPCASILDNILIPCSTKVSLYLSFVNQWGDYESVLRVVSRSVASKLGGNTVIGPAMSMRALEMHQIKMSSYNYHGPLQFSFFRNIVRIDDLPPGSDAKAADYFISLDASTIDGFNSVDFIGSFCIPLPLQSVEVLSVSAAVWYSGDSSDWKKLFAVLLSVSAIRFIGRALLEDVADTLFIMPRESDDNWDHTLVMPQLKTVLLEGIDFKLNPVADPDDFIKNLMGAFTTRKNACEAFSELIIKKCVNIGPLDVLQLGSIVKVVWDGVERYEAVSVASDEEDEDEEDEEDEDEDEDGEDENFCETCGRSFDD